MLTYEIDKASCFLEATVDGPIRKNEYVALSTEVDALLKTHDKFNFVAVVRSFGPFAPAVWWKDMIFRLTHRHWLNHAAVVSDPGWIGPVTRFFAPIYPAAIRAFPLSQLDEARAWARSGTMAETAC